MEEDLEISDGDSYGDSCRKAWPVDEGWHTCGRNVSSSAVYSQEETQSKFWKKVGVYYLGVLGFFGCSMLIVQYYGLVTARGDSLRQINLEMVAGGDLQPRFFKGTWISRRELLFQGRNGSIALLNVESGEVTKLIGGRKLRKLEVKAFSLSRNKQFLLLETSKAELRNFSRYYLFEVQTKVLGSLPYFDHISWGAKGEQMILALKGSLYYKRKLTASPLRISIQEQSGTNGLSHNAGRGPQFFWHPKGLAMAYVAANLTLIDDYAFPIYSQSKGKGQPYPDIVQRKYMKGRSRSNYTETLWIVNFEAQRAQTHQVMPPDDFRDTIRFVGDVQWIDLETVMVLWLSRAQDQAVISVCRLLAFVWQCDSVRQVIKWKGGFRRDDLQATIARGGCYLRLPLAYHVHGDLSTYWHLARIDLETGKTRYLTQGQFNVLSIRHIVEKASLIFYEAELKMRPGESHLMASKFSGGEARCVSCGLGAWCSAEFHAEKSPYFVLTCKQQGVPQISVHDAYNYSLVRYIEDNEELKSTLATFQLAQVKTLFFTLENGRNLSTQLYLPPINKYKKTKSPLIIEVLEGQKRDERYSDSFWGHHLATTQGYAYIRLQERDTFETGYLAIELARYVTNSVPMIDSHDVAIVGRALGGYVALRTLLPSPSPFSCAVAISPVTNWLYYDAEYSEALLGTVEQNKDAYENANIVDKAHKFRDKKLLLMHGTADEVVHFQNTAMLMKALGDKEILYDAQLYPDAGHDLSPHSLHMLERIQHFLSSRCFTHTRIDQSYIFYKYIGI